MNQLELRMRQYILFAAILVSAMVAMKVSAAVFAPEWTEFCPPKYCESNENVFSKDATYWYKRRLQFNNALARCAGMHGEQLDSCYAELRAAENRKNEVWDVRYKEKMLTTQYNREYEKERMEFYGINEILKTIKK